MGARKKGQKMTHRSLRESSRGAGLDAGAGVDDAPEAEAEAASPTDVLPMRTLFFFSPASSESESESGFLGGFLDGIG